MPDRIYQDSEYGVQEYDSAGTLRAGRIPEHQMVIQPFGLTGNGHYSERPATPRAEGGDCGGSSEHLIAFGGNNTSGSIDVATACNAHGGTGRLDFESETFLVTPTLRSNGDAHSGFTTGDRPVIEPQISHALTSGGADASEDGTGRGTPLVACFDPVNVTSKANRSTVEFGQPANTLHQGGLSLIQSFQINASDEVRTSDIAYTLNTNGNATGRNSPTIAGQFGVRRLTPVECEALQGFPRNWTAFGDDGKPISDSARYRMLGNAVCVPTAEWIARRIAKELEAA